MKTLPHDDNAERQLLGAMLLSRDAIAWAAELQLTPDDFYDAKHGRIFEAITRLYQRGEPADPFTVAAELGGASRADLVGLQVETNTIRGAKDHARKVEELSLLRRLIGVAGDLTARGYEPPAEVRRLQRRWVWRARHLWRARVRKVGP